MWLLLSILSPLILYWIPNFLTSVCNYCDFLLDSEFFNMDSLVVDSDSFDFLLEWEFLAPVCTIATFAVFVVDFDSFDSVLDSKF